MQHDLIVIGEGPAAHAAAIEAKRLGLDVLLVLPPSPDGGFDPLFSALWRALACRTLASAPGRALHTKSRIREAAQDARRRVESSALAHIESLRGELHASQVQCLRSPVRFRASREIQLGSEVRSAGALMLSEVSRPRRPRFFPFDDQVICDDDSIFQTGALPRSLAVVGANESGCELACTFAALGASVVLIDRCGRLMRGFDRDLLRILHPHMQDAGIHVVLGEEIERIRVFTHPREPFAQLELSSGRIERCESVAVCAGRVLGLGPAAPGPIQLDRDARGFLLTDEYGRTSQPGVYGIGDVSGIPPNHGTQNHLARVAVLHAAGFEPNLAEHAPNFVHTIPEIASVGLSQEACELLAIHHVVGMASYPARGGCAAGSEKGLLKIVAEAVTGRVIGVHVVGLGAGDTLQLGLEYVRRGASVDYVAGAILHTPGPAEAYRLAAGEALVRMGSRGLRLSARGLQSNDGPRIPWTT